MMIESITVMVENTFLAFGGKYIRRVSLYFRGGHAAPTFLDSKLAYP